MTRSILVALMMFTSVARVARADPAADAHALGERFAQAVASGTVDAALALYADDARLIYPGAGQEARGKAAIKSLLERELPTLKTQSIAQKAQDTFAIDDTHIMNVGRWESVVPGPGGRRTTVVIRTTELMVKQDGVWRYLVDHASIGAPPPPAGGARGRRRR